MIVKKITSWFAAFLELQLVIFLISLPIIIHWGLAVSCMLPIANIIFTPLLALFLWCSCAFTFCSILHIPCSWITSLLDLITTIWKYLLSFANPSWLIGFTYSTLWLALSIALLVILFYIFIKPKRSIALVLLVTCTTIIFSTKLSTKTFSYNNIANLNMAVLKINNKVYLLDNGGLCSKHNFYSWIDYTILPTLIKTTGITTIDVLVLYKPSKKLPQVVQQFAQQTNIKTIYAARKQNCFEQIFKALCHTNIQIHPIK